ncbi:nucleotidyltransferase AbiEii toxin of type IV toxin-antitoxin system [Phyllobacterium bourgognense]|uniref:Nucleotidyltransferase AbiEii toxin of type IV toxin-antitoxin system n=1 Tax=Phyllobacterium bourgognense TaxID=314236 RepID=A0A368YSS9_9HYPH|nr:nucleotidyl transferase AbiEii/AbiGii toxin family protein [Phyllobacterium bourgognense]RCW81987.1 nucleotidyltransferase AbiEii toxin of type IV toxin-antitoxin system [Phyllobacterium bourgognense]
MIKIKLNEHRVILEALRLMDHEFLVANGCWFGGGTAIVLKLGEYRQSLDVDFLCSSVDGYRALRSAAVERGVRGFFPEPVETVRGFKSDQYGLRTALGLHGQIIKFEIIREARIQLRGHMDEQLGLPTLVVQDLFAEKLLANADRCHDRSVAYRDAIDLGMLVIGFGNIPDEAIANGLNAYGEDVPRKLAWAAYKLHGVDELRHASDVLQMERNDTVRAVKAITAEVKRIWPQEMRSLIGTMKGAVRISEDFDDLGPEWDQYIE